MRRRASISAIRRSASATKRAAEYGRGRIEDVDQVVGDARALGRARLRGADVHAAVDQRRSTLTISTGRTGASASAIASAAAVLPEAVGPARHR
jgi:hypothetical protein